MTLLHMGALHPVEQALTFALAFGPFVALGVVVWLRRRQEHAEHSGEGRSGQRSPRSQA